MLIRVICQFGDFIPTIHIVVIKEFPDLMTHSQTTLHPIWDEFPAIRKELQGVLDRIEANLDANDADVEAALIEMFSHGGKLLRPAFTILIGRFFPAEREPLLNLAATVEMLHTASLVHDDIIDDSPKRRHAESVQSRFGKDVAAYTGDYLFAVTFRTLADNTNDINVVRMATRYLERILSGELTQRTNHYKRDMTIANYEDQIAGKTAALFVLAANLGIAASHAPKDFADLATDFAYNVGMAFQILDDLLDYSADSTTLGKPTLNDVREGVYSAPLIIAMQDNEEIQALLAKGATISDDEAVHLGELVRASGALAIAEDMAVAYTNTALEQLSDMPEHESKRILLSISQTLLTRND